MRTRLTFALLASGALAACSADSEKSKDLGDSGTPETGGSLGAAGGSAGAATSTGGTSGGPSAGGRVGTSGAPNSGGTGTGGARATDAGLGGMPLVVLNPWGVAPSASSSRSIASWAPDIAAAGIGWVRGFDQGQTAATLAAASASGLELAGILFFSDPGPVATFPVNDLPGFANYVTQAVQTTMGAVHHWEVWNEPPNFTENKDPAAYAQVAVTAYDAAKAADPTVQIGLAAQSNNVNWLAATLDAGATDHFDYVTVHPYETLGLVQDGWEAEYMSIVPTLRKLLADKNPAKANVPIWFTEVGEPVGGSVTAEHQADTLVKAFVMGIAQGVTRVHWFEPLDGDSGPFGLIGAGGVHRPSYTAVSTLVEHLGTDPHYVGWLLAGGDNYAFVFDGPAATVMVIWAPRAPNDVVTVAFGGTMTVVEPGTGAVSNVVEYALSPSPALVVGIPAALRDEARANAGKPFPWNGDFTDAPAISFTAPDTASGLHPLGGPGDVVTIDGVSARDQSGSPAQSFTVDPNFSSYTPVRLQITAVLRRNGADAAGFNLKYESTSGWKSTGSWFGVPGSDQWYTQTWTIDDPQFVGKWGYNFSFDSDSTDNSKYSVQSVTVTKL